jgi:two-component sensor histidine kinase
MSEVVRSQLGHYLDQQASQIEIEGPGLIVTPEAAQNIGLAVHELSTNAAKYGALSVPEGRVAVCWKQARNGSEEQRLHLSWTESGGPQVAAPSHRGFGQVVTEQLTARALQGKANLMFDSGGVRWTLDIPANHILTSA